MNFWGFENSRYLGTDGRFGLFFVVGPIVSEVSGGDVGWDPFDVTDSDDKRGGGGGGGANPAPATPAPVGISDEEYARQMAENRAATAQLQKDYLDGMKKIQDGVIAYQKEAAEEQRNTQEMAFLATQADRYTFKMADRTINSVINWAETVHGRALNAEAAALHLESPDVEVMNNWESFAEEAQEGTNRDRERWDTVGDLLDGKLPEEAQEAIDKTQDGINKTQENLPKDPSDKSVEDTLKEIDEIQNGLKL